MRTNNFIINQWEKQKSRGNTTLHEIMWEHKLKSNQMEHNYTRNQREHTAIQEKNGNIQVNKKSAKIHLYKKSYRNIQLFKKSTEHTPTQEIKKGTYN